MPESYGRRKDDLMTLPSDISPEVLANLTDSQRTHIRILQNITAINTSLQDVQHDVAIHNKLLVTGNGEPSLQERMRNVEKYISGIQYWSKFIGGALIVQTIAFFAGIIVALVRFLPILESLAKKP